MYINGLKYACSTCIKGHRSSHCSHVDRPLFEIRKKGRPVTQCTFCRDLRKTKQVHIKCACNDKKVSNHATAEKPILIYRNSEEKCKENTIGFNQHGQQCTCPNNTTIKTNTNSPTTTPTTTITPITTPTTTATTTTTTTTYLLKSNVTQMSPNTQMNVTQDSSSLLAPLCPTAPSLVKEEQLSYSWALITSPSANQQTDLNLENPHNHHNNNNHLFTDMILDQDQSVVEEEESHHLGFIFHKPTSTTQRFLDGQPRIRRRRSTNQKRTTAANSTTVTPTNYNNRLPVNAITIDTLNDYNTPPSSTVSPPTHRMSTSSTASSSAPTTGVMSHDPMDVQFDYLTEQLEILSNSHSSQHNHGFIGDLANADELTAILNNVLQKEEVSTTKAAAAAAAGQQQQQQQQAIELNHSLPQSSVSTPVIPTLNSSHCGSFVPRTKCCKPMGSLGGESVVITITPLTKNDNTMNSMLMMLEEDPSQQKTTTRIVTCYCGNQCTCPGCLVHPGNFFLGTDPYSGLMINPSSSASSSCYGSDEEDLTSIYSKSNNPPFTF
ncbi:hypothetical protein BD770DRAFT_343071 [Pilaira anomala]|nr:hypothetical protein BD770DRAFT_343071 [Pilaira anomala]